MGGIAFSLIGGGDIQTPSCCVPWCGQTDSLSNWGPLYPVFLVPRLGMGKTWMWLGFGLGPGLRAGLRRQMGPAGAVSLLRGPL